MGGGREPAGGEPDRDAVERVAVAFDPGLVRVGRLVGRSGAWIEVEFSRRQRHTLAVGAGVQVGFQRGGGHATPNQSATVTERSERGAARRYRLLLPAASGASERAVVADRPFPKMRPVAMELRFGRLDFPATLTTWMEHAIRVRVAQEIEAQLHSTDAIELVCRGARADPEIRVTGWIERRVLDGVHVNYDFRVDEHLSDDGARQHTRLRSVLESASRPDAAPP